MQQSPSLPNTTSIVFDTNVLISAFVFKKFAGDVYQYCAERYSLYTSEWILAELSRKLASPKFKIPPVLQDAILLQVRADATVLYPTNALPTNSRDLDDNPILQVALFINADFLITGDDDLLELTRIDMVEIIRPRKFFEQYIA
jgi:uncharacterized protein